MVNTKEFLPLTIELDQNDLEKKIASRIAKLYSSEDGVRKAFGDLSGKLNKATADLKSYKELKFEASRNYIQMMNQGSELVNKQDLANVREHISRLEQTIDAQTQVYNLFRDMELSYKEYVKSLKELNRTQENLLKHGTEWRNTAGHLRKSHDSYATGTKLEKYEKRIRKYKAQTAKSYSEMFYKHDIVSKAFLRLNQSWQKLKAGIKNVGW